MLTYHPPLPRAALLYCLLQFVVVLLTTTHFLAVYPLITVGEGLRYGTWLASGLWIVGGLMEQRAHYRWIESTRLVITAGATLLTGNWFAGVALSTAAQSGIVAMCAASVVATWILFTSASPTNQTVSSR